MPPNKQNTHSENISPLFASNDTRSPFLLALAGDGASFRTFTSQFARSDFTESIPYAQIQALLGCDESSCMGLPHLSQALSYNSAQELFAAHPDIKMAIDLSEGNHFLEELKAHAPTDCSILSQEGAILMLDALSSEHPCHTCIRDLKRAQDLFSTLIDQVDEDVLLLDAQGIIRDMNSVALQRLGGEKKDHIGKPCHELNSTDFSCPDSRECCPLEKTRNSGTRSEQMHTRVLNSGKMQYLRIYTYPVFGSDGCISHIIELRRDITNRTNMEQKLQQAERMAAIGELATYIAHEIRNPLFAIGGFANSLLRSPKLDDNLRQKAEVILTESKRLDKILKTTLNFARPTAPDSEEIDLNIITADTLQLMRIGCEKRGVTAKVDLAENLAIASGNPDMLKQCLINLVKNAMEAMEEGGHLTVRTGMTQTHVYVTVEDTGHGIPAHQRENVFSPFFSTKGEGAGLGLAMTKKIIDEMGGYVDLLSQEGKGTSITLNLLPMPAVNVTEPSLTVVKKDFSDAVICGPNGTESSDKTKTIKDTKNGPDDSTGDKK